MLANQIDLTIIKMPVWNNRRIIGQEVRQHRQDKMQAEGRAHTDLQCARRDPTATAQAFQGALDRQQSPTDFLQKAFALLSQGQFARIALE